MAQSFNWGVDLPMGGFGILAARHLNGHLMDARYFLDGNDSEAIQAAIDFAAATSEASGVVWLPRAASAYAIDAQITVPSNMTILGDPHGTPISLDTGVYVFKINAGASDVVIKNLIVDGNQNTGGLVETAGNVTRVTISNCQIGTRGAESTTYIDGYVFNAGSSTIADSVIEDCTIFGGTCLVSADGGANVRISGNRLVNSGETTSSVIWVDLNGCDYPIIRDNYAWLHDATKPLDRAMYLNNCDYARVSGNDFWGGNLSQELIEDCLYGKYTDNDFMHGATSNVAFDDGILFFKNACHKNVVDGNRITCVSDLSGTIPVAATYSVINSDSGGVYGTTAAVDNAITDNLFGTLTESSPTVGEFRVTNAGATFEGSSGDNFYNNNTYFALHHLTVTAGSGGAATQAFAFPGISTNTHVQATYEGTTVQGIRIHSVTANTVTMGLVAAGNFPSSKVHMTATNDF